MSNNICDDELKSSLVNLACEAWRFSRVFQEMLSKLNEEDYSRFKGRYSWFRKKLDDITGAIDLRIIELPPGTDYDPGMAVTPINISDFEADTSLQIENMLEPVIMSGNSVIKTGTVILRRAGQ